VGSPTRSQAITLQPLIGVAFDLSMPWLQQAQRDAQRWLVLASSPICVAEALYRCRGGIAIVSESDLVEQAARRLAADMCLGGEHQPEFANESPIGEPCNFSAAIWACPEPSTWRDKVRLLGALAGGNALVVLCRGQLMPVLGPLGTKHLSGLASGSIPAVLNELFTLGYRVKQRYGVGGLISLVCAALSRAAAWARRPELVDRCEAAFRLALTPPLASGPAVLEVIVLAREVGRN